jgi:hypothetical protein
MSMSSSDEPRRAAAIPWYKPEQWTRWREISDDRDGMSEAYDHWLHGANHAIREFTKSGLEVHRVTIDVDEFIAWTEREGVSIDGHARAEFASNKLGKKLLRPDPLPQDLPDSKQLKEIVQQLKGKDLSEVWEPYLRRPTASVCPIFRETIAGLDQFASGTLIRIADKHFLLTAAHVTDDKRPLMVPAKKGFTHLYGSFAGSRLPESGSRNDDRYDIAYISSRVRHRLRTSRRFRFLK